VNVKSTLTDLVGNRFGLERLATLLSHREPVGLASEALSGIISNLGATAGSLFYATRPPLRVRRGQLSEALTAHLDQWEASIEQRIATGPWKPARQEEPLLASRPVQGTDQAVAYFLIQDEQAVMGSFCLVYPQHKLPTGNQRAMLARFLQAVSTALAMVVELTLTKERLGQLTLFYQVAQSMSSTFDQGKVLENTMQLATAVLDATASALMMVDEQSQELVFEYAYGELGSVLRKQRTPLDEGIAGWVATRGVPVVVNDVESDPRFSPLVDTRTGFLTRSVICVPLQIRGKTIGVLEALNKRSEAGFDSEDLNLMVTTANQAAIAIENARLYQSLRDERDRIIQAQEDVRRQVARNLHDGTVQFLSAISMGIDHLERLLEIKPEAAQSELSALRALTRQATRQARLALFELRPLILETQGLIPALEAYVQQLEGGEKFGIHLEVSGSLPNLNSSVAGTVFAIIQEAVNNAKKHASPRDVWLRLSQEEDRLQIVIQDNGKGFDLQAVEQEYDRKGSIGLLSMRERADLIDGHFEIQSSTTRPYPGTKVILHVPLPQEPTKSEAQEQH
jgi:signal transduction histidine kinase